MKYIPWFWLTCTVGCFFGAMLSWYIDAKSPFYFFAGITAGLMAGFVSGSEWNRNLRALAKEDGE